MPGDAESLSLEQHWAGESLLDSGWWTQVSPGTSGPLFCEVLMTHRDSSTSGSKSYPISVLRGQLKPAAHPLAPHRQEVWIILLDRQPMSCPHCPCSAGHCGWGVSPPLVSAVADSCGPVSGSSHRGPSKRGCPSSPPCQAQPPRYLKASVSTAHKALRGSEGTLRSLPRGRVLSISPSRNIEGGFCPFLFLGASGLLSETRNLEMHQACLLSLVGKVLRPPGGSEHLSFLADPGNLCPPHHTPAHQPLSEGDVFP